MRVLAAGVTRLECGYKPQLKYLSNAELLVEALQRGGHEVEFRDPVIGEPLDGFDVALIGMAPFLSTTSDRLFLALDVIERAAREGCRLAMYVDDWNFTRLTSQLQTVVKYDGKHLVRPFFASRKAFEWGCERRELMTAVCRGLHEKTWPVTVIPAFTWGNHEKLVEKLDVASVEFVDPSAVAELRYQPLHADPSERTRQWVLGVLQNERTWLEKQGTTWPVNYLGGRASKADGKLPERELIQLYAESWGVLSPPHTRVVDTGWWRYRFIGASVAGAVMVADKREVADLGEPYQLTVAEVEAASQGRLEAMAADQRAALLARQPSLEDVVNQMTRAVEAAVLWDWSG